MLFRTSYKYKIHILYKCKWKDTKKKVIKKINRKRKISCNLLADLILKKNYSGNSYDSIMTSNNIKNNIKISKSAVIQKRASNANILSKLNDRLISYIYIAIINSE